MKTIGLIGGMSWESSREYYTILNESIATRLGGNHSARCILYSFDFQEVEDLQRSGDWNTLKEWIMGAGSSLRDAGAHVAALCTNTMHKVTDEFEAKTGIPLVHIADAVAAAVSSAGYRSVGLLGTRFTMEETFYTERLRSRHDIDVVVPDAADRQAVDRIIFTELVKGIVRDDSRREYERAMNALAARGAEAIILGCTEIGLLVKEYRLPLLDTVALHCRAIVEAALG